ncbi:MAG: ribonucleoside-diphosphate reductase subunit alpha [Gammaproteobacteria bacterium]|nr:MAG: ribonucleoside-diphosphate reductase subunit alpha [Gammaproteobacteria bacterium]
MQNIESPLTQAPESEVKPLNLVTDEHDSSLSKNYSVVRRNGKLTGFTKNKIAVAMTKAFLAVEGGQAAASTRVHETVEKLTDMVVEALTRRRPDGGTFHIEDIQDQVELAMMRNGDQKIARAYVLYREQRANARAQERVDEPEAQDTDEITDLKVKLEDGSTMPLDKERLKTIIDESCIGLESTSSERVYADTMKHLFDGIPTKDVSPTLIMSARGLIDNEPEYSNVAARLLLDTLRTESLTFIDDGAPTATFKEMGQRYPDYFQHYIRRATELELLDKELLKYDLKKLGMELNPEQDHQFTYLGLQTLYDRYFIHYQDTRFELPQAFFMRVAMGLAINEMNREERAIEFYRLLSSFDFMSSTPTLFNSGTLRPQLSSCYLTTVPDDLEGIFNAIKDDAMLSKFAGGLGNDWTRVRAMGSHIKGTNGKSQGVVPFLKVANDTAVAVNQGGKRKGAMCAYLETWHLDIEDFLDLRKNTGEERRRTHDMNTANWIPDLFMKRVAEEQQWTLFSPDEVTDLHELYGPEFETAYIAYEARADRGEIKSFRRMPATDLWRKMLGMLFETGHPWVTFKDPCNIRSPQKHSGVVHSSNLCTEITLNTSDTEIAVCNLGSVNLPRHVDENGLNLEKLEKTINTAMRMLDNVIDYNYYSVQQARTSNLRHRPVGLGIMGFQDALYRQHLSYGSEEAIEFADQSMEAVSYYAIQASTRLAEERGTYSSYQGSLWSQGILPIDSIAKLKAARGDYLQQDESSRMNWDSLRQRVMSIGMRNSNTMAIAPTATISNICGVSQSIEPIYQNLYVKSNLSGEFTIVNPYLVDDLKAQGIWDDVMVNDLKYYDGSVQNIDRVPDELKKIYSTAFEIDSRWLVEAASRRQKWIDQGQSLNLYMAEPSGKKLDNLYKLAWVRGLKTTYYLRSLGATAVEITTAKAPEMAPIEAEPQVCSILDPECEACQ